MNPEQQRLIENAKKTVPLELWGPYLSERQWGTVREDYSSDGNAWTYFTFEDAASRIYRWGEDGIAGISDLHQNLCLALCAWNGKDPLLKERLFGLTNPEGNHGEDVKELYYYLDNTPTHSFMQYLYKYPLHEFPYSALRLRNLERSRTQPEFELLDTGIFNDSHYVDIHVTYAKNTSEDICISIEVTNRSDINAELMILPTLWFRNRWRTGETLQKPVMERTDPVKNAAVLKAVHDRIGTYYLYYSETDEALMTENETNDEKFSGLTNASPFVKDAFHDALVKGNKALHQLLTQNNTGTKFSPVYRLNIPSGQSQKIVLRLSKTGHEQPFEEEFEAVFSSRKREADLFFESFLPHYHTPETAMIQRQALAGLLWNKQFYQYDVEQWLEGDAIHKNPPPQRKTGRNAGWLHLKIADVLLMPDKWEYPWFATWDLCFHCIPMAMIDPVFAKHQLLLFCREWYMSPSGHIPAYEWNFSDVNPPIHAWATMQVYRMEKEMHGNADIHFLKRIFQKLMLNFTWWANREDENENNLFSGGFLGLDNIGVIDRNGLPPGTMLEQADATAWMGMYAINMMDMAMEIALVDNSYEDMVTKFYEHFTLIAASLNDNLWDEEGHFFYDRLHVENGEAITMKIRSVVGLSVLFNVGVIRKEIVDALPDFRKRVEYFKNYRISHNKYMPCEQKDENGDVLISLVHKERLLQLLGVMLDENEFLSGCGIRALSKYHDLHPFNLDFNHSHYSIGYVPGESESNMFGGNSNWRGPVWIPLNYLIIQTLYQLHAYYGDHLMIPFPAGSGKERNAKKVADALAAKIVSPFYDGGGSSGRQLFGKDNWFYQLPENRNLLLFYEYFHGDNARGLGASHQTGWTALIAVMLRNMSLCR